jgi:hypothetical protein
VQGVVINQKLAQNIFLYGDFESGARKRASYSRSSIEPYSAAQKKYNAHVLTSARANRRRRNFLVLFRNFTGSTKEETLPWDNATLGLSTCGFDRTPAQRDSFCPSPSTLAAPAAAAELLLFIGRSSGRHSVAAATD